MVYMGAIATVLVLSTTGYAATKLGFEDPDWFRTIRILVFTSIPVVFLRQRLILAKAQRELSTEEDQE